MKMKSVIALGLGLLAGSFAQAGSKIVCQDTSTSYIEGLDSKVRQDFNLESYKGKGLSVFAGRKCGLNGIYSEPSYDVALVMKHNKFLVRDYVDFAPIGLEIQISDGDMARLEQGLSLQGTSEKLVSADGNSTMSLKTARASAQDSVLLVIRETSARRDRAAYEAAYEAGRVCKSLRYARPANEGSDYEDKYEISYMQNGQYVTYKDDVPEHLEAKVSMNCQDALSANKGL